MPVAQVAVPLKYINGKAHYKGQMLNYTVDEWQALTPEARHGLIVTDGTDLLDAGYATDAELAAAVADMATDAEVAAAVANMATDAELAAGLAGKANQGGDVRFLSPTTGLVYRLDTDSLGMIRAVQV